MTQSEDKCHILEGYLIAIMLEAHLAGGYLCPKLLTFEPMVVKKVHPGAELKGQS